jgi:hypothetical protein
MCRYGRRLGRTGAGTGGTLEKQVEPDEAAENKRDEADEAAVLQAK